jgi:mitochondrial import receptor subunit TOM40
MSKVEKRPSPNFLNYHHVVDVSKIIVIDKKICYRTINAPSRSRFARPSLICYVGIIFIKKFQAFPILMADVDPEGNLNANIIHAPTDRTRVKFISQIQQGKWASTQMTADYKADSWTSSLTLGNPDIVNGSGVAVVHYLRSVTRNLALGAELAYQASPQLPGGHVAVASLASRLSLDTDSTLAATLGNAGQIHGSFWQKCSDQLQMGVEIEANLRMKEVSASIAYEVDLPKANLLVRGSVDSNMIVRSVVEKKLVPFPFTLALCGLLNHKKSQYQFGCGLIIG